MTKLNESRRLVIPELGVFVAREDGRIMFSELMRGDDGVFRSAVASARDIGEAEAGRIIERFVADIRHSLEHGMSYRLEGMGLLSRDERGLVVFRSRAEIEQQRAAEHPVREGLAKILAESAREDVKEDAKEVQKDVQKESAHEPVQPSEAVSAEPEHPEHEPVSEPEPKEEPESKYEPEPKEVPAVNPAPESVEAAATDRVAEREPETERAESEGPNREPVRRRRPKSGSGGVDMFLIVGIVIAIVAIAAIIYGLLVSNDLEYVEDDSFNGAAVQTEQIGAGAEPAEAAESAAQTTGGGAGKGEVVDLSVPSSGRK